MEKIQINVRVDVDLKAKVEEACEYLGTSITEIVNRQFRSTIDAYYKKRSDDTRIAREIAEGDQAQFMFDAAKREAAALHNAGYDSYLHMKQSADALRYTMFYNFVLKELCKDLGLEYVSMPQRMKDSNSNG